ncbi:MAG TPA: hypothetical protein VNF49_09555 [Candidatus Binataceae bacterium]|nr:hypothetical protein [Candidatus Binataceae bacterium]
MSKQPEERKHPATGLATDDDFEPGFMLLFAVRLKAAFKGFAKLPEGVEAPDPVFSRSLLERLHEVEARLLGEAFLKARRTARWSLGRVTLDGLPGDAPRHADVCLLAHKSGAALWEVWLAAPAQPFDAARWIGWLDAEAEDGLVARLRRALAPINRDIAGEEKWAGLYFPLTVLRTPRDSLATLVGRHGPDLVRLLFRDRSSLPFKAELVTEELARDYGGHEGRLMLLARRGALAAQGGDDTEEVAPPAGLPPRSALPFLVTLELLLLERAILQHLYERLAHRMPRSVDELLALKEEVLDALEEYYGAITNATRFSDAVTADGEVLLGLGDLYDAVRDRLDAVSFAITTRYQKRMTLLQFWLTVVFGATEIGFIASGIATWYYRTGLGAVLAWTVGASLVSGLALVLLLRGKLE